MRTNASLEEVKYLCHKTVETFQKNTKKQVHIVSTASQYVALASDLTKISFKLPKTAESLKHQPYPLDTKDLVITENQFRNAILGQTKNPQNYLVDSCYIYCYGLGRDGFIAEPKDEKLELILKRERRLTSAYKRTLRPKLFKLLLTAVLALTVLALILTTFLIKNAEEARQELDAFMAERNQWNTIKNDMSILHYQPTNVEIDSLTGLWLCYTGSPQARPTEMQRYHMVVSNLIDVKYKNGYFTFTRYGASFNHVGYMVFESPGVVSIHSHLWTGDDNIQSPRHSIMQLGKGKKSFNAVSASWNFDLNDNLLIAIREVYVKIGTGGKLKEIYNTLAGEQGKVVDWYKPNAKPNDKPEAYPIRIRKLDYIPAEFQDLINEKSIILADPQEGIILNKPEN